MPCSVIRNTNMPCSVIRNSNGDKVLGGGDLMSFTAGSCDSVLQCPQRSKNNTSLPNLLQFIKDITIKSKVSKTTMVVGLIYVERLKKTLPSSARGDFDTPYKIFLSAILVASKYLSDYSLQNKTIASITNGLYTIKDVNTMERSFLGLLKYNLWVDVEEVKSFLEEHNVQLDDNFNWTDDENAKVF